MNKLELAVKILVSIVAAVCFIVSVAELCGDYYKQPVLNKFCSSNEDDGRILKEIGTLLIVNYLTRIWDKRFI